MLFFLNLINPPKTNSLQSLFRKIQKAKNLQPKKEENRAMEKQNNKTANVVT